jgi:hypothetical protein
MRVMTTPLPTIMISWRRRFWICGGAVMTMAILVAVAVACHSVEGKGDNPDPHYGAHFECTR